MTDPVPERGNAVMRSVGHGELLSITGLSKAFAGVPALSDLDLEIGVGEIHAVLGENGSGKSTLIKILSGYHRPDEGLVQVAGHPLEFESPASARALGLRFVHQDLGLIDSMSVADNLGLGPGFPTRAGTVRKRVMRRRAEQLLDAVGLDLNAEAMVGDLAPAHKTGLAIARALGGADGGRAVVLVLDEPTAALPAREVDLLMDTIEQAAASGVGVLYVSHRLDEVFRLARRVTVLRDGVVVARDEVASLNRPQLVSAMIGQSVEPAKHVVPREDDAGGRSPALQVQGLKTDSLADVSFQTFSGEVVGIAGITGSGRETILGSIFGRIERLSGTISVAGKTIGRARPSDSIAAGIAYLPADRRRDGGILELSARENLTIGNLTPFRGRFRLSRSVERRETAAWFDRLQVRPRNDIEQSFVRFSGGNQQKILIGKWLRKHPAVFLLDEPTQGVDVGARARLHQLLLDAAVEGMSIVISSSDIDELASLCNRVLVMRNGNIATEIRGSDVTVHRISIECQQVLGATAT